MQELPARHTGHRVKWLLGVGGGGGVVGVVKHKIHPSRLKQGEAVRGTSLHTQHRLETAAFVTMAPWTRTQERNLPVCGCWARAE